MLPCVSDIVQVCGAVCNLQPSLIKSRSKRMGKSKQSILLQIECI